MRVYSPSGIWWSTIEDLCYIQTFANWIQQNVVHTHIFSLKTLPVATYACANSNIFL